MRFVRIAAALILTTLPVAAFAQSTSSSSDISALLAQLDALEQQIAALTGTSSASAAATSATATSNPDNACPELAGTLSLGSSGPDVANLQLFLGVTPVTGYFGTLTQTAVEQWQAAHGIVSGGSPATTGFGVVGPRTRAAIESACGGGTSQTAQCLPTQPPQQECATGWQPVTDQNGCTEYYQCSISLPTAANPSTSAPSSSISTTSCPVVAEPSCSGSVVPFQTDSNGCVVSYECVL